MTEDNTMSDEEEQAWFDLTEQAELVLSKAKEMSGIANIQKEINGCLELAGEIEYNFYRGNQL